MFDRFLKEERNGFEDGPRVQVTVRKAGAPFAERFGDCYPLEGTRPTTFYLGADGGLSLDRPRASGMTSYCSEYQTQGALTWIVEKAISYVSNRELGSNYARFVTRPLEQDLELVGPMRLHLTVSVDGFDADLFVAVREIDSDGSEVTAESGAPISLGWQRVSMRNVDPERSTTFRAWHTYDRSVALDVGVPVLVEVNVWPAAWIVPAGHCLAIDIAGGDQSGAGEFRHPPKGPYAPGGSPPLDNGSPPPATVTIHSGGEDPSYLVAAELIVPRKEMAGPSAAPALPATDAE